MSSGAQKGGEEPTRGGTSIDAREALAHQLYFERRDWRTALALWSACEAANGPTLDSGLAKTHCLIELADPARLPSIRLIDPPATTLGRVEAYAHLLRTRAFQCLSAGETARACQLTRLLAVVEPQLGRVYREAMGSGDPGPRLTPPKDDDSPLPFERELRLDDATADALLEGLRARRVLFVSRGAYDPAPDVITAALFRQYSTSINAVGVMPALLNSHVAPDNHPDLFPDRLRDLIAQHRPEIIFYDDLLVSGLSADPGLQPLILDILDTARRSLGARIVVTYPDSWYDGMDGLIESALDIADLFHIFHPALLAQLSPAARAKMFCYPHPVTDPRPAPARPADVLARACFVGGINWANMPRLAWWTEIMGAGLPVDLYPTISGVERTPAQYADLVSRYAVMISFTSRSNHRRVLTSRSTEAPLFGTLLLEEFAEDTSYFLRPFEHYVPFSSLIELTARLEQLISEPALCEDIARRGSAWVRRHFTGHHFWARLYHQLYAVGTVQPTRPSRRYVPVRVDIPTSSLSLVNAVKSQPR